MRQTYKATNHKGRQFQRFVTKIKMCYKEIVNKVIFLNTLQYPFKELNCRKEIQKRRKRKCLIIKKYIRNNKDQ